MGRKVGTHILEIVEAVEKFGAATKPQIRQVLSAPIKPRDLNLYCSRAVGLSLLDVDRSKHPMEFRPTKDWRQRVLNTGANKPKTKFAHITYGRQTNSVFALGKL